MEKSINVQITELENQKFLLKKKLDKGEINRETFKKENIEIENTISRLRTELLGNSNTE